MGLRSPARTASQSAIEFPCLLVAGAALHACAADSRSANRTGMRHIMHTGQGSEQDWWSAAAMCRRCKLRDDGQLGDDGQWLRQHQNLRRCTGRCRWGRWCMLLQDAIAAMAAIGWNGFLPRFPGCRDGNTLGTTGATDFHPGELAIGRQCP